MESTIAARAKENLKTSTGGDDPQLLTNSSKAGEPINTRSEIAKTAGVSTGEIWAKQARERQGERTDICQNSDNSQPLDTKREIAAEIGAMTTENA